MATSKVAPTQTHIHTEEGSSFQMSSPVSSVIPTLITVSESKSNISNSSHYHPPLLPSHTYTQYTLMGAKLKYLMILAHSLFILTLLLFYSEVP